MADRGKSLKREESEPARSAAPESGLGFDFAGILAVADALPMPIAYLDEERRYRFINKELAAFFEQPRSELLGKTMAEVLGEEAMAARRPMIEAALRGERQWFTADFPHPSRGQLTIQAEYLPQLTAKGEVAGVIILINDVTEQRLAERALKESEARFRRIADSAPVMMWVSASSRTPDMPTGSLTPSWSSTM